jgi:hypothetical protein
MALLGFIGLGVKLAQKDLRYVYAAAPLLLLMLPYIFAAPLLRYRYPAGGLLVFLAADMAWRATDFVLRRLSSQSYVRDSLLTASDQEASGAS